MKRHLSIILLILSITLIFFVIKAKYYSDGMNLRNNKFSQISENTLSDKDKLTITTVYDNYALQDIFDTGWGFSCLIEQIISDEGESRKILFDTGGDSDTLFANMNKLDIDPSEINFVFISHRHSDHTGGLEDMSEIKPEITVFYPEEYLEMRQLFDNVWTIGSLGDSPKEQSLILETEKGLIVICGCAHAGVDNIIRKTNEFFDSRTIYLVMGGFHLKDSTIDEIKRIVAYFQEIGVLNVAPSHCTGDKAIEMFQEEYKENFIENGVGRKIEL